MKRTPLINLIDNYLYDTLDIHLDASLNSGYANELNCRLETQIEHVISDKTDHLEDVMNQIPKQ